MIETVCLCGSTRFRDDFDKINKVLTRRGLVVLTISYAAEKDAEGNEKEPAVKEILDMVHFKKILLADALYIVGDGYIGYSTAREILWGDMNGKAIMNGGTDWLEKARNVLNEWRNRLA